MPNWSAWPFPLDDPYPEYRAARECTPVRWDEHLGTHIVLSHEHALAVLRDSRWSSDPRNSPELLASLGGSDDGEAVWGQTLLMSDPPSHTRLRSAVNRFFTPRAVERLRDRIRAIVEAAWEPLLEGESLELMGELAYPIPLAVIAELFDVGLEGAEVMREETPMLARALELDPSPEQRDAIAAAAMNVMLFLVPIVAQRRSEPGDDLLSALIHPSNDGVVLETDEVLTMCLLLLAAGHETTVNLIGNGTLALLEDPRQLAWLAQHPESTAVAVEELLRYDSPVQITSRVALDDFTLAGVEVAAGQQAVVVLGAANRDPARYGDPERLDLARSGPPHVAFGNGIHYCVGAGLVRLEAEETFKRLAQFAAARETMSWSYERDPSRTFRRLRNLHISEDERLPEISLAESPGSSRRYAVDLEDAARRAPERAAARNAGAAR